jgi:hypothetical protein
LPIVAPRDFCSHTRLTSSAGRYPVVRHNKITRTIASPSHAKGTQKSECEASELDTPPPIDSLISSYCPGLLKDPSLRLTVHRERILGDLCIHFSNFTVSTPSSATLSLVELAALSSQSFLSSSCTKSTSLLQYDLIAFTCLDPAWVHLIPQCHLTLSLSSPELTGRGIGGRRLLRWRT